MATKCFDCRDTGFLCIPDADPRQYYEVCPYCENSPAQDTAQATSPSHLDISPPQPQPQLAPQPRAALKHSTFMTVAVAISKLSTCRRLQVGCVLLGDDGRVLGTGYNGALPGRQHCDDETCGPGKRCLRTRHAERSALDYSQGVVARCYVTHEPCVRCTQDLIARGCREVYYLESYVGADDEKTWRQRHVDEAGVRWVQMRRDGSDGYTV